jgi:hypothetical protein
LLIPKEVSMPDANGLLLPNERQTIAAVMSNKMKTAPACPWCGANKWEVGPFVVVSPAIRADGTVNPAGAAVPLVTLLSPCGYVAHFAAKLFGVEVRSNTPPSTEPTPGLPPEPV